MLGKSWSVILKLSTGCTSKCWNTSTKGSGYYSTIPNKWTTRGWTRRNSYQCPSCTQQSWNVDPWCAWSALVEGCCSRSIGEIINFNFNNIHILGESCLIYQSITSMARHGACKEVQWRAFNRPAWLGFNGNTWSVWVCLTTSEYICMRFLTQSTMIAYLTCTDCGSRMHPAVFVPTCYNCDHLLFCDGKLQHMCEHCEHDYVAKGSPGAAPRATRSAQSVERELENKIFNLWIWWAVKYWGSWPRMSLELTREWRCTAPTIMYTLVI